MPILTLAVRIAVGMTLLVPHAAHAATFCVDTSAELRDALTEAGSNGANDVIRIKTGTYTYNFPFIAVAFSYETAQNFDITLQGGWTGNDGICSRRFLNPASTVLSGAGSSAVLWMTGADGSAGDMIVEQLTVRDGNSTEYGAGLRIGGRSSFGGFNGDLVIERVLFDNNNSGEGAAGLSVETNGGIRVRNSVFHGNSCDLNACAGEFMGFADEFEQVRNTFGNNTLVGNVCNDGAPSCSTGGFLINGWFDYMPHTSVHNNLFALNDGNDLQLINDHVDLLFNNINQLQGNPQLDFGNMNVINPRFVDLLDDDYHLQLDSPMRNAGAVDIAYSSIDYAGVQRVQEGRIDVGAFEFDGLIFENGFD